MKKTKRDFYIAIMIGIVLGVLGTSLGFFK